MVEEGPGQKDAEVGQGDSLLSKKVVQVALAVGIYLSLALLVSLGFALHWYLTTDLAISKRQALVQGLASGGQALAVLLTGAVALIGLYLTRQNTNEQLRHARENTEKQLQQARESQERTQASAQETLRLTEQGQITERFTRAIEQLGATDDKGEKKVEIRLGGIYALERISRESENDYWPIMQILAAYVREHAPRDPAAEADLADLDKGATRKDVLSKTSFGHADAEIQAILDTIGRRSRTWVEEVRLPIRLERTNLRGALFFRANLSRLWLLRADLRGAYFRDCNLEGTNFTQAELQNAVFLDVDLQRARGLNQEQIEQAFGYETELPDRLSKPAHWEGENSSPA